MDILFTDSRIKKLCEDERIMRRIYGVDGAKKLKARLADIEAAAVVTDVKRGNPHPLKGNLAGTLALNLHGGFRLTLMPANEPLPQLENGSIDWGKVDKVRIISIEDYHD